MIATMKRIESGNLNKQKKESRSSRPKIILYKKVIDLSQSTEAII